MGLTAKQKALLDRWNTFLSRLEQRSEELRAEASENMQQLVDEVLAGDPIDTRPVHNALSGVEGRLRNLPDKIDKAWEDEAEPLFEDLNEGFDGPPDLHDMGTDRRDEVKASLENRVERFKLRWATGLYRQMWPKVEAALREEAECSQCGKHLQGVDRRFSKRVTCPSCGSVNQVLVPAVVATYRAEAPTNFALEASRSIREAIDKQRVEAHRISRAQEWAPEPIASLDQWEALERQYWERFAKVVTETGWEPAEKAQELVESRMEMFKRQAIMTDQRWRRARGL